MSSDWDVYDETDAVARKGYAARIRVIAGMLEKYPADYLVSSICSRSQVSAATARGWVREARELQALPELAEAYAQGQLSTDQVAALRVLAEPGTDGMWVETLTLDPEHEFRINQLQRLARRETARKLERTDEGRYLKMQPTRDERYTKGCFQLHPEEGAFLEDQLDARVPRDTPWDQYGRAYADALMQLVAEAAGKNGSPGPGGRGGSAVKATVLVRSQAGVLQGHDDTPGELPNGSFVPANVVRDLAEAGKVKDLDLTGVRFDTEQIPEAVRRWIWHRDGGQCRSIDCPTPNLHLQIHHMADLRAQGMHHHPSNALLQCWPCHHVKIHRQGWRVIGDAQTQVQWLKPDGTIYTPPPIVKRARAPDTN